MWVRMPHRHVDSAIQRGEGGSAGFRALDLAFRLSGNLWETGCLVGLTVQQQELSGLATLPLVVSPPPPFEFSQPPPSFRPGGG